MNSKEIKVGNVTYYHYSFSDLRRWIERGRTHGDNGFILTKKEGNLYTYRGFGTIECPRSEIYTLTSVHNPLYDTAYLDSSDEVSYSFQILDFSK